MIAAFVHCGCVEAVGFWFVERFVELAGAVVPARCGEPNGRTALGRVEVAWVAVAVAVFAAGGFAAVFGVAV